MPPATRIRLRRDPVASRIMLYVNDHYKGNLTHAAAALGCDYNRLWRAARGFTSRGPSLDVLQALATASKRPIEWWLNGEGA